MVARLSYKLGYMNMWPFCHYPHSYILQFNSRPCTCQHSTTSSQGHTIRLSKSTFPCAPWTCHLVKQEAQSTLSTLVPQKSPICDYHGGILKAPLMYLYTSSNSLFLGKISLTSLQSLKIYTSWITCYPPLSGLAWPPCGMTHIHRLLGTRPLHLQKSMLRHSLMSGGFAKSFLYSRHTCRVYLIKQEALHWFATHIIFFKSLSHFDKIKENPKRLSW